MSIAAAFPPHVADQVAKLVAEARTIDATRESRVRQISDCQSEITAINQRLIAIDAEIKRLVWDDRPLR